MAELERIVAFLDEHGGGLFREMIAAGRFIPNVAKWEAAIRQIAQNRAARALSQHSDRVADVPHLRPTMRHGRQTGRRQESNRACEFATRSCGARSFGPPMDIARRSSTFNATSGVRSHPLRDTSASIHTDHTSSTSLHLRAGPSWV